MKKWLIVLAVLIGIAVFVSYRMYNKPRTDLHEAQAAFSLSASELVEAFASDEQQANTQYLGQILEVRGRVSELIEEENAFGIILDGGDLGTVYCAFVEQPDGVATGRSVTVKGVCSGYLMDVVLNDCVIKSE